MNSLDLHPKLKELLTLDKVQLKRMIVLWASEKQVNVPLEEHLDYKKTYDALHAELLRLGAPPKIRYMPRYKALPARVVEQRTSIPLAMKIESLTLRDWAAFTKFFQTIPSPSQNSPTPLLPAQQYTLKIAS